MVSRAGLPKDGAQEIWLCLRAVKSLTVFKAVPLSLHGEAVSGAQRCWNKGVAGAQQCPGGAHGCGVMSPMATCLLLFKSSLWSSFCPMLISKSGGVSVLWPYALPPISLHTPAAGWMLVQGELGL